MTVKEAEFFGGIMSTDKTDVLAEEEVIEDESSNEEVASEENEALQAETADQDDAEQDDAEQDEVIEEIVEEIVDPAAQVAELQKQLDEALRTNDELTNRLRSVSAAFQKKSEEINATKKRLERQSEYKESKTRGDVVSAIFEPFENLKRSIENFQKAEIEESHIKGLEMVKDGFWESLQKLGLEEIPGKGSFFNPNIHQALTNMPVTDPNLNNIVIEVYSTGYRINDIIIKPSQVIVGMFIAPPEEEKPVVEETDDETTEKDEE